MRRHSASGVLLGACATVLALGGIAPAAAGGGHGGHGSGHYGYGGHSQYGAWRYDGHRGSWRNDHYSHHYRYKRHHGGLSGAEAGLIAAGIVGVAILLDNADQSSRVRYDDGYDRRYNDRYSYGSGRDDFYYRRDDRRLSDDAWNDYRDDGLSQRLEGGRAAVGEYNFGAAYNDCKAETREAARREGLSVGLPARPDEIVRIESGDAVRFVTKFELQDRGRGVRQTMVCEADAEGVRFLELV
ncbi:MAG: hypothetical protein ABL957_11505 [Parvularculaceae bacterium]